MADRVNQFELKLLTLSKEVGLRRLRSYSATLGGGAQIFHSLEELAADTQLKRNAANAVPAPQSVIIYDSCLALSKEQMQLLHTLGRVFVLQQPASSPSLLRQSTATIPTIMGLECYMQCSLMAFLESTIVRTSMAQMCRPGPEVTAMHLLRWGHAGLDWQPKHNGDLSQMFLQFIRKLQLAGENRRLTEMFLHFISTHVMQQVHAGFLKVEHVQLRADGIVTLIAVRCNLLQVGPQAQTLIFQLAEELAVLAFPTVLVNRCGPHHLELAAVASRYQSLTESSENIFLMLAKRNIEESATSAKKPTLTINKAG